MAVAACCLLPVSAWAQGVAAPADSTPTCERELVLRNTAARPLAIELPGTTPRALQAGKSARWCSDRPEVAWSARAASWLYRGVTPLAMGERRVVELAAPGATLVVVNRTGELQSISIDGSAIGKVDPGKSMTIGPIAAGAREVAARSLRSATAWGTLVSLRPGATARLLLPEAKGAVRLQNPLDETANLSVDGHLHGAVDPGQKLSVVGVPPGGHEVRWVGRVSGKSVSELVMADDPGDERSPTVKVALTNKTGEDLDVPTGLRDFGAVVAAKAKLTWRLPRGEYGVTLTGAKSGLPYRLDIHKKGPAELIWAITRPVATLRLDNRSGEPLEVDVPVLGPLPMAAGAKALLRVPAGRLALAARWKDKPKPLELKVFLRSHEEATWSIAARQTWVIAKSGWPQPVELYLDGARTGTIKPNADFRVPLGSGRHRIEARVAQLGWRETAVLDIRDGDQRQIRFAPPTGAAHIDNDGAEVVEFWVDRVQAAVAQPGRSTMTAVGPGQVHGEIRRAGAVEGQRRDLLITATQQVQVPLPAAQSVAVEIAALVSQPLSVSLDGGDPVRLKAREVYKAGPLSPGEHLLRILQPGRSDASADVRARLVLDGSRAQVRVELRGP